MNKTVRTLWPRPGSRVTKILQRIAPLGSCTNRELKRIALEMVGTKDQANRLLDALVKRGLIERRSVVTAKGAEVHQRIEASA